MTSTFVAPLAVKFSSLAEPPAVRRAEAHQTQLSFTPPPVFQLAVRRNLDAVDMMEREEEFED